MTTFTCNRCSDESEPAECPDRFPFEDHGLCCIGTCRTCQYRIDDYQGEL